MEVGLNITAAYEDGITYPAKVLDVDEKQFFSNIMEAARNSFNLACTIAYPIKETISLLIGKAFADAKTLGLQQNIIDGGIIEQLLARAESSALGVKAAGNLSVPEKTPASAFEIGNEAPKANEGSRVKSAEPHQEPSTVPKEQPHPSNGQSTVQKEQLHPPKEQSNVSKEQPPPSKGQPNSPGQEPKAKDAPISTEVKVKELVEKTKQFTMGEVPTAASLIEEAGKQIEAQKQKHKTGSATTFQEHAQKRNSSEGNRPNPNSQPHSTPSNKQPDSVSQSNQDEMKKVEQLTKELMKKGTLRK
ncbi:hypothetical protein HYU13_01405 [Candidatus Woesearchaeota archaeon]|nr:hypothetical protein [Candidatus Woesearchaeota archaeon]